MTEEGTMVLLRGIPIDEALLTYIGTLPDLIRYYLIDGFLFLVGIHYWKDFFREYEAERITEDSVRQKWNSVRKWSSILCGLAYFLLMFCVISDNPAEKVVEFRILVAILLLGYTIRSANNYWACRTFFPKKHRAEK